MQQFQPVQQLSPEALRQQIGDKVIVRFEQSCSPYSRGELAGVTPEFAVGAVAQGAATIIGKPNPRNKDRDTVNTAVNAAKIRADRDRKMDEAMESVKTMAKSFEVLAAAIMTLIEKKKA